MKSNQAKTLPGQKYVDTCLNTFAQKKPIIYYGHIIDILDNSLLPALLTDEGGDLLL